MRTVCLLSCVRPIRAAHTAAGHDGCPRAGTSSDPRARGPSLLQVHPARRCDRHLHHLLSPASVMRQIARASLRPQRATDSILLSSSPPRQSAQSCWPALPPPSAVRSVPAGPGSTDWLWPPSSATEPFGRQRSAVVEDTDRPCKPPIKN